MNKTLSALGVAIFAAMSIANAQVVVYAPEMSVADQHIGLRGWGSGTIAQTDEMAYEGTSSIRVSSRNLFQGGIMMFGNPISLAGAFDDKANMLRITFQVPDSNTTMGPGGPGGGAPSLGGPVGGGGVPGGGVPGGGRKGGGKGLGGGGDAGGGGGQGGNVGGNPAGGGAPGGAGGIGGLGGLGGGGGQGIGGPANGKNGFGGPTSTPAPQPPLSMIRMIVTTTDGKKSEAYVSITTSGKGERGWKQVAIPLKSITGFDRTNKMIKELAFAGDSSASFYLGDIRVINDTTPITGEARIDRENLALGDEAVLTAYGFGGSSVLKYEWDFNSDGKADAEGAYIKHKFRTPGDFVVTLIVSDMYGLKQPYKTQVKVHVNP